jgi:hypothetical protein
MRLRALQLASDQVTLDDDFLPGDAEYFKLNDKVNDRVPKNEIPLSQRVAIVTPEERAEVCDFSPHVREFG